MGNTPSIPVANTYVQNEILEVQQTDFKPVSTHT